jgi:hypothetical protein
MCLIGGIFWLILPLVAGQAGEARKAVWFEESSIEEVQGLLGDWEANLHTRNGWNGTLRAKVSLQRNHPEGSEFHAFLVLTYDLRYTDKKPETTASGSARVSMFTVRRGNQRYLHCLSELQVLQKEFFDEVLQSYPYDKKAKQGRAEFQPSVQNTVSTAVQGTVWTLEVGPALKAFLPKDAPPGPEIDWDSRIVWKKAKGK